MRQNGAEMFEWENKLASVMLRREQRNSRNVKKYLGKLLWRSLFHVSFKLYVLCFICLRRGLLPAKGQIASNYIVIKEEYI
jgi:hypothetical protein